VFTASYGHLFKVGEVTWSCIEHLNRDNRQRFALDRPAPKIAKGSPRRDLRWTSSPRCVPHGLRAPECRAGGPPTCRLCDRVIAAADSHAWL